MNTSRAQSHGSYSSRAVSHLGSADPGPSAVTHLLSVFKKQQAQTDRLFVLGEAMLGT